MSESNPYAPPLATVEAVSGAVFAKPDAARLAAAKSRLLEHVATPHALEMDRLSVGRRWTMASLVTGGLFAASVGASFLFHPGFIAGVVIFAIFLLVFGIRDWMLGPRSADTTPLTAFKNHLRAARWGRDGYVLASIAPTGREEIATPPDLGRVPVGEASGPLSTKKAIKAYFATFLRPGTGQQRWSKIHAPVVVEEDGDVAYVRAKVAIHAVPQWAYVASIVAFLVIRLVGLILFGIVLGVMKKSETVHLTKTFIRGDDGLWYALQGGWDGEIERV